MEIKIKNGLDIPIKGRPSGPVKSILPSGEAAPPQIALDLSPFEEVAFTLLAKEGDVVKIGQPLALDKSAPGRAFASPAGGTIKAIRRGLKRKLLGIVIETSSHEEYQEWEKLDVESASVDQISELLNKSGIFAKIRRRPFSLLADPEVRPRDIFVKAIESAPIMPPAELQVAGHEEEFQAGLNLLARLTKGKVHLVYAGHTNCKAFLEAKNVEKHTAEGPHPISNHSVHIQRINPIRSSDDIVWTLNAHDVVAIGHLITKGRYFIDRVIGIGGPGVIPERTGFFMAREGFPISALVVGRIKNGALRLISGDPLMGRKVDVQDFLGFYDYAFTVIPENNKREFLHFMRLGFKKFTASKAYLSGFLHPEDYNFTTSQHGEHRAFVDSKQYKKVQPLQISTMHLVKAVMAEDFDLAEQLGLLEVDSEDFALPAFVCPSKIEMTEIIRKGLRQYAKELI